MPQVPFPFGFTSRDAGLILITLGDFDFHLRAMFFVPADGHDSVNSQKVPSVCPKVNSASYPALSAASKGNKHVVFFVCGQMQGRKSLSEKRLSQPVARGGQTIAPEQALFSYVLRKVLKTSPPRERLAGNREKARPIRPNLRAISLVHEGLSRKDASSLLCTFLPLPR
jgi:hypothetical protein